MSTTSTLLRRCAASGRRASIVAVSLTLLLVLAGVSQASHLLSDTDGHSTLEQVLIGPNPAGGYATLHVEQGTGGHLVRDGASESNGAIPNAQSGREDRRRSLAYFGQLTDFQLADEESPARVEFLDPEPSRTAASGWRPQEALHPFAIDWSIRQLNRFAPASPVAQGDGTRAPMDFALMTGDQADNMQRNEINWTRELLEGVNTLDFNSGTTDPDYWNPALHPSCAALPPTPDNLAEALRYTGVQDYDDYDEGAAPYFYDPDDVRGTWATAGWPTYTGLMDRAQQLAFEPAGLDVPAYVTNGNHDGLVQGNEDANAAFEDIATGCFKALGTTMTDPEGLDPNALLSPSAAAMLVPPDPDRRFVDKRQIKALYNINNRDNGHGYGFVDPAENTASSGAASYYAWDPPQAPGFRFVSIDTLAEGGVTGVTDEGNIDEPQFQWLKGELDNATARDRMIVIFGHHPVRTLTADVPDEQATPCVGPNHNHNDNPEHNHNPGCDIDTRSSEPIHLGTDRVPGDPRESLVELLDRYPHVLAYVAGHTHENRVNPFARTNGGVWWGIETAATADWPVQHRLIEVMDNRDGTLSIFGTVLDGAMGAAVPPPGNASGFTTEQLASINRVFAYNDPQQGPGTNGQGTQSDRNVELLVRDPRRRYPRPGGATPLRVPLVPEFEQCTEPNSEHVAPLDEQSCTPPNLSSGELTTSSTGRGLGSARLDVVAGNPQTPADEADVRIDVQASDVQKASDGSDYEGRVLLSTTMRITDGANGPGSSESATMTDFRFSVAVQCVGTPASSRGGTCALATTSDALIPSFAREGDRAVIATPSFELRDAGADGEIMPSSDPFGLGCPPTCGSGDEKVFLRQGVFAP